MFRTFFSQIKVYIIDFQKYYHLMDHPFTKNTNSTDFMLNERWYQYLNKNPSLKSAYFHYMWHTFMRNTIFIFWIPSHIFFIENLFKESKIAFWVHTCMWLYFKYQVRIWLHLLLFVYITNRFSPILEIDIWNSRLHLACNYSTQSCLVQFSVICLFVLWTLRGKWCVAIKFPLNNFSLSQKVT